MKRKPILSLMMLVGLLASCDFSSSLPFNGMYNFTGLKSKFQSENKATSEEVTLLNNSLNDSPTSLHADYLLRHEVIKEVNVGYDLSALPISSNASDFDYIEITNYEHIHYDDDVSISSEEASYLMRNNNIVNKESDSLKLTVEVNEAEGQYQISHKIEKTINGVEKEPSNRTFVEDLSENKEQFLCSSFFEYLFFVHGDNLGGLLTSKSLLTTKDNDFLLFGSKTNTQLIETKTHFKYYAVETTMVEYLFKYLEVKDETDPSIVKSYYVPSYAHYYSEVAALNEPVLDLEKEEYEIYDSPRYLKRYELIYEASIESQGTFHEVKNNE